MGMTQADKDDLRGKALHDVGDCHGESGRCEYCAEEDADREMGIDTMGGDVEVG